MIANKNKTKKNGTQNKTSLETFLGGLSEIERDFHEERATIMQFDGGMCRSEAEKEAAKLTQQGKIKPIGEPKQQQEPQITGYELSERMAIMGENCEPDQTKPYVTGFGVLVIPSDSNKKYHYWNGGQSVCDTLKELGRCDLIPQYKSIYSN